MKDVGLHYVDPKNTHEIADAVAWSNNQDRYIKGVIEIDDLEKINTKILKELR